MDIQRANYVLEKAILHLQAEEVEALWERFKVPTPKQMHKKYGMALTMDADEAMEGFRDAVTSLLVARNFTDPFQTASEADLVAALADLVGMSKRMKEEDREEVLEELWYWKKHAGDRVKRLEKVDKKTITSGGRRLLRNFNAAMKKAISSIAG